MLAFVIDPGLADFDSFLIDASFGFVVASKGPFVDGCHSSCLAYCWRCCSFAERVSWLLIGDGCLHCGCSAVGYYYFPVVVG